MTRKMEHGSAFLKEIHEQPEALRQLVAHYSTRGKPLLRKWAAVARKSKRVIFCGMGTSELAADFVLADLARQGLDVSVLEAGELLHYPRPIFGLMVLVSQSGESIEIQKLAKRLRGANKPVVITNNANSSVARAGCLVLPMCAGVETSITTKTYVNTLALLFLMSQALRGERALVIGFDRLSKVAAVMGNYDQRRSQMAARLLAGANYLHFIARGPAMAAARQAALTFMEGTRTACAAFTGGGFRHNGSFEMVDNRHHCVFFIPKGATAKLLVNMAAEVAEKGSRVVSITDYSIPLRGRNVCVIRVPSVGEDLFPLAAVTTQELLLDALATRRGLRAGEFRYGEKVTLKE